MNYNGKRILVVDFETFYDRKEKYDLKAMCVTEYVRNNKFWPHGVGYRFLDDEATHWLAGTHQIEAWVKAVDWKNTVIVGHNIKFDGSILAWRFNVKPFAWMDTQGLAKAILGEEVPNYSLKTLALYLGLKPKGDISCEGVLHPSEEQLFELGEYCKNDVEICKAIYELLMPKFPESQLWSMDWTIRCFLDPRLELDKTALLEGVINEKQRREDVIRKSGVAKDILSSNKQFAAFLTSKNVEVPTKRSGRTGKEIPAFAKTDQGLAVIAEKFPELVEARLAAKSTLLETRGQALLDVAETGTFPFDVSFSGATQTHRYSGGSSAGGNPQNFTRNSFLRAAILPPLYSRLIVGDFAAIELRLLAWLAQEPKLMNKIKNDEDTYCDFASMKYGRIITKADKAERQYGKESILGLGYGMGWKKFKTRIKTVLNKDISDDEAKATVNLYRDTYNRVPQLWENTQNLIPFISSGKIGCLWFAPFIKVRRNTLVLPSGLEIKYPNLRYGIYYDKRSEENREGWHYDVYYTAHTAEPTGLYGGKIVENICQALAGELCKEAIERIEKDGIRCVGQVHDEILAITRPGCSDHDVKMDTWWVKKHMEQSPKWMSSLKLRAEVGSGPNWNEAKI